MHIFIGVGSNLGDRAYHIHKAIKFLKSNPDITIEKISSIIETVPVGGPAQGRYLNGIIKIKTGITARAILGVLQNIENKLGRVRTVKNGPRTIDLDILLCDMQIINETDLKIPHPRMLEREFVMKPLLEIEPDIIKQIKAINKKFRTLNSKQTKNPKHF